MHLAETRGSGVKTGTDLQNRKFTVISLVWLRNADIFASVHIGWKDASECCKIVLKILLLSKRGADGAGIAPLQQKVNANER